MNMEDDGWIDRVMLVAFVIGMWALVAQQMGGE